MIRPAEQTAVLRLFAGGASVRSIASQLGLSRTVVGRVLFLHVHGVRTPDTPGPPALVSDNTHVHDDDDAQTLPQQVRP